MNAHEIADILKKNIVPGRKWWEMRICTVRITRWMEGARGKGTNGRQSYGYMMRL